MKPSIVEKEDIARWFTFGGFWGFVFYLLSLVGILSSHRQQPARINMATVLTGLVLQVLSFVGFTAFFSVLQALVLKKNSTQLARERIGGGTFEENYAKIGLGASLLSLIPFSFAVGNLRLAEKITGKPAFADDEQINWTAAVGITAVFSSITGLAVARITSWVAQDARWQAD
jgi:hypothetical protein